MYKQNTITQTSDLFMQGLRSLPALNGVTDDEIKMYDSQGNEINKKTKNPFGTIFALLLLGGLAYGIIVYVLPKALAILGMTLGVVASIFLVIGAIAMFPTYKKWLSIKADSLYRKAIENDPFIVLEQQKQKFKQEKTNALHNKEKITVLQKQFEQDAYKAEVNAKEYQAQLQYFTQKAVEAKDELKAIVDKLGKEKAMQEDEYYNLEQMFEKSVSTANRMKSKYEQEKVFIDMYGIRGNEFKKLGRILDRAYNFLEQKEADLITSIDMLQKQYDFVSKSERATSAVNSALKFSDKFEVAHAINIVNNIISDKMAKTVANIRDIDSITQGIGQIDINEQLARLESLTKRIDDGEETVKNSKIFKNVKHVATQEENVNSGGFAGLL